MSLHYDVCVLLIVGIMRSEEVRFLSLLRELLGLFVK